MPGGGRFGPRRLNVLEVSLELRAHYGARVARTRHYNTTAPAPAPPKLRQACTGAGKDTLPSGTLVMEQQMHDLSAEVERCLSSARESEHTELEQLAAAS